MWCCPAWLTFCRNGRWGYKNALYITLETQLEAAILAVSISNVAPFRL